MAKGWKHKPETVARIRAMRLGRKWDEATKEKIRQGKNRYHATRKQAAAS